MAKYTTALIISLISAIGAAPATAQEGGYDMPEYLIDIENIDPYDASSLDFLDDVEGANYQTRAFRAYQAGDYENSARFYIAKLRDGKSPVMLYNLACDYALMGEPELAVRCLEKAAEFGFAQGELVKTDPDFESLHGLPGFDTAAASIAANGEAMTGEGMREYFELTSLAPGTVILPDDFDADRTYPVIVALHGGALTPEWMLGLRDMFDGTDFIFVALQGQNPALWDGQLGYNWVHYGVEDLDVQIHSSELAEDYILNSIKTLKEQYKTDGVYLVGFSDGGAMSYITGIRNPDAISGIILMGGYYPNQLINEEDLEAGDELRIFIVHGTADTSIAYEQTEETLTILREAGYDAELFAHDGDHILSPEGAKAAQTWFGF